MHTLSYLFRFHPRNEGPSCLKVPPALNFSEWGTGKLNQTDGLKGLLKRGIYICATACKNLANMNKQQKHTDWGPTDPPPP